MFYFLSAVINSKRQNLMYKHQNLTSKVCPRTENVKHIWIIFTNNFPVCENLKYSTKFFNPLRPEFTIVIFIHYKPRIAVAILDL